jgi:hypothetical protein
MADNTFDDMNVLAILSWKEFFKLTLQSRLYLSCTQAQAVKGRNNIARMP